MHISLHCRLIMQFTNTMLGTGTTNMTADSSSYGVYEMKVYKQINRYMIIYELHGTCKRWGQ